MAHGTENMVASICDTRSTFSVDEDKSRTDWETADAGDVGEGVKHHRAHTVAQDEQA